MRAKRRCDQWLVGNGMCQECCLEGMEAGQHAWWVPGAGWTITHGGAVRTGRCQGLTKLLLLENTPASILSAIGDSVFTGRLVWVSKASNLHGRSPGALLNCGRMPWGMAVRDAAFQVSHHCCLACARCAGVMLV